MNRTLTTLVLAGITLASSAVIADTDRSSDKGKRHSGLTEADCAGIIENAVAGAKLTDSDFRPGKKARMQIACLNRKGEVLGFYSMKDAWIASVDIAFAKAYTAAAISSDENALTSRTIGLASQPGGPLWQIGNSNRAGTKDPLHIEERGIIQFPGGIPLYKNSKLVGGIGVSGDSVDVDETVAACGAKGYEPALEIRSDTVLNIDYTTTACPF